VQFKADGYNHFHCPTYPAHSHYSLDGNNLSLDWGQYGSYELVVDPGTGTMQGCEKFKPAEWRRCSYIRPLEAQQNAGEHAH
jgi:hypothetical protein